ncbi:protein of unknown function (plasmid) [Agrobacterium pusense]|uniref:Uncharacterized protein n=1 Tax=Agrobacterium pusense TaxID=648995 RepID=U4QIA4_9HYPH|nr:protein of unknown function [Agrobacterium pusense]
MAAGHSKLYAIQAVKRYMALKSLASSCVARNRSIKPGSSLDKQKGVQGSAIHPSRLHGGTAVLRYCGTAVLRYCGKPKSSSRWMARVLGGTMSLSNGSGDRSDTKKSICKLTRPCQRPASELVYLTFNNSRLPYSPDQADFNALAPMRVAAIIEGEIHLAKRPKLFRLTEPALVSPNCRSYQKA